MSGHFVEDTKEWLRYRGFIPAAGRVLVYVISITVSVLGVLYKAKEGMDTEMQEQKDQIYKDIQALKDNDLSQKFINDNLKAENVQMIARIEKNEDRGVTTREKLNNVINAVEQHQGPRGGH